MRAIVRIDLILVCIVFTCVAARAQMAQVHVPQIPDRSFKITEYGAVLAAALRLEGDAVVAGVEGAAGDEIVVA